MNKNEQYAINGTNTFKIIINQKRITNVRYALVDGKIKTSNSKEKERNNHQIIKKIRKISRGNDKTKEKSTRTIDRRNDTIRTETVGINTEHNAAGRLAY